MESGDSLTGLSITTDESTLNGEILDIVVTEMVFLLSDTTSDYTQTVTMTNEASTIYSLELTMYDPC